MDGQLMVNTPFYGMEVGTMPCFFCVIFSFIVFVFICLLVGWLLCFFVEGHQAAQRVGSRTYIQADLHPRPNRQVATCKYVLSPPPSQVYLPPIATQLLLCYLLVLSPK